MASGRSLASWRDSLLVDGPCGLLEEEWDALLRVAPDAARALAEAGAPLRAKRWDALEKLLALLPPGGDSVDERFDRMQPEGDGPSPELNNYLLAAVYSIQVGWSRTAPPGD